MIMDRVTPILDRIFRKTEIARESHIRTNTALTSVETDLTSSSNARARIRIEQASAILALDELTEDLRILTAELEALRRAEIVLDQWDKNSLHILEVALAQALEVMEIEIDIKDDMANVLTILYNLGYVWKDTNELISFVATIPERDMIVAMEGAARLRALKAEKGE